MKKFVFVLLMLCTQVAYAGDAIYTIADGTKLKCTGKMVKGSIDDYKDVVDYYYFKDNKLYSKNLVGLYGKVTEDPRKVLKLKISDDKITFKDRYYETWTMNYKWVKIDRHTGEYAFNAKRDFGTWYRLANVLGSCSVVE